MLAGALCFLWLLTLALLVYLPDAVPVLLLPLLPAAALTAIACCLPEGGTARSLLLVLVLAPMALLLSAAVAFETSQGFRLAVAVWPWIGLFTVAAAAFARGRWLAPATAFTVALLAAALVAAALLPLHTAWRPQHLNAWYIQDSDRPEALVQILTDGTVPAPMHAAAAFLPEETASLPWSDERYDRLASVPSAALPPPTLALDEARATGGGRELRLRLASSRNASQLRLYIPTAAGLQAASVDGSALVEGPGTETDDFIRLRFHGVQGHEVPLTLRFAGKEPVEAFLVDMDPRMPAPASPLLEARPEWAAPAHGGDQSVVFTRVRF